MNLPGFAASRTTHSPSLSGTGPLPYSSNRSLSDFEIERSSQRSTGPSRRILSRVDEPVVDEEFVFRDSVARVIAAKSRPFTVCGRIPFDPSSLILFFRSKSGVAHSLDFPIDVEHETPPALNVLIAACNQNPPSPNFDDFALATESLFYPLNLPLTATLEISNHPMMDAIRGTLFPSLPLGHYLTARRDRLDVITSGRRMSTQPPTMRNDGRVATINITLPVRFRGGALVIRDANQSEERYFGRNGKSGDMEWVAFLAECECEIEVVQKGCKLAISYGVYLRTFGSAGVHPEPLITPSDNFLDLFSPILNTMRGRKIAFYLINDYGVDPAETLAESLVPHLKGGDALLYHAIKVYKLVPELHWTAGGYIWPIDRSVDYMSDTKFAHRKRHSGGGAFPPVRGIFAGGAGSELEESENMRHMVEGSGATSLAEAGVTVLLDWDSPNGNQVGKERVPFISGGEYLEKLVVNVLLVAYVP